MTRLPFCRAVLVAALGILLVSTGLAFGQAEERITVASTDLFAFHSDFDTNLNDALIATGVARNKGQPELFQSGAEQSCFDELPPPVRAAWNRAVDYYAEIVSPTGTFAPEQYRLRMDLAGFEDQLKDAGARRYAGIVRNLRAAASPAYEACRWPTQDAENRRWIEDIQPRLAAFEQTIARRLMQLYQKQWHDLPIQVDVVETVNWSGANSTFPPGSGGHLLVSISYRGPAALEIVFHEASHGLMLRGDPIQQALAEAAEAQDMTLPRDLWHVVLFYTTGDTVRRVLAEAGRPDYRPMICEIFDRGGSWNRFRDPVERTWPAYLDGDRTLPEASADLLQVIGETAESDD